MNYPRELDWDILLGKSTEISKAIDEIRKKSYSKDSLVFASSFASAWDKHIRDQEFPLLETHEEWAAFCRKLVTDYSEWNYFQRSVLAQDLMRFIMIAEKNENSDYHKNETFNALCDDVTILREIADLED